MREYCNPNAEIFSMAEDGDVVCITTNGTIKKNGTCVMGRGIARQVRDMLPGIDLILGRYLRDYGNRCFQLGIFNINNKNLLLDSFPVKHNWNEFADINLIKKSCTELVRMADTFGYKQVWLPAPGCGNGKLSYEDVRPVITTLLDDRFICVRRF